MEWPWREPFSRAVVEAIRRDPVQATSGLGYHMHLAVEPEVETLRDLGGTNVWRLCDLVATRAAMLRELG